MIPKLQIAGLNTIIRRLVKPGRYGLAGRNWYYKGIVDAIEPCRTCGNSMVGKALIEGGHQPAASV